MKNINKLIYFLLPLMLTSCIKEGYDKENCPGEYFITPTKPSEIVGEGEDDELDNYTSTIIGPDGKETPLDMGSDHPIDLEDGNYTVVVVKDNDPDKVTIDKTTVTVTTRPDGTANDAGDFLGGHTDIVIDSNAQGGNTPGDNTFTVPTISQTRPLVIKVKFEGCTTHLESASGVVDGIALSRDLNNGFVPTDGKDRHPALSTGSVSYDFEPDDNAYYTDSRTLLGIDGDASQILTLTVTYAGGVQKTYTFDITRDMDGFHTEDVLTPWVITITLLLGADFEATIQEWDAGPETWMDAH